MRNTFKKHIELTMVIFSFLLLQLSSLFQWDSNPIMGLDKLCADTLVILLSLGMIIYLGYKAKAGFTKKGFLKGILLGIPFYIIGIASIFVSNVGMDLNEISFMGVSQIVLFTVNMLLVGANEEIWMRGLVLNCFIQKYGYEKKSLWKAISLSAIIFGLIHVPNMFFMEPLTVVVQAINAMSAGVLFAVIFIKSKNIWAGIIVHAIVDWCSLVIGNCFVGGNTVLSMSMNGTQALGMVVAGSVPPIVFSIIYMRKYQDDM